MRLYKCTTFICSVITVISFIVSLLFHYYFRAPEMDFWLDISLGIFSGAILTTMTSVLSYLYERRKNLEGFIYHTRQILNYLSKYQVNMELNDKIRFFTRYAELDKSAWSSEYGETDFMLEKLTKSRRYIYESIYNPILQFNNAVESHYRQFIWHLDGTGTNARVMGEFVLELEGYLVDKIEQDVVTSYDNDGNPAAYCKMSGTRPKLTREINSQLDGRYYEITYGKRIAAKMSKEDN